jgi:hypothetical protein
MILPFIDWMKCANHSTTGNVELLEQLISIAARMIFCLNGHVQFPILPEIESGPGIQVTPSIQAHVRKLFWVLYSLDKDLCFQTLRPPIINDDECDMELDPTQEPFSVDSSINKESVVAFHPADIRLAILKGKIYRDLYSVRALRITDMELLKRIRELDEELDVWKSNLPTMYRPERHQTHEVPSLVAQNLRLMLLHLEYYQSLTMIHRVSTRCLVWKGRGGHKIAAITSSVDLCLEASRSTVQYLEASRYLPGGESFW